MSVYCEYLAMDSDTVQDEIDALRSIYCRDGEFTLYAAGRNEVSYSLQLCSFDAATVYQMNVVASKNYPAEPPLVSVQCPDLHRKQLESIEVMLRAEAAKLVGQPMILELADLLQRECTGPEQPSQLSETDEAAPSVTVILSLDHIRSRNQYCRLVSGLWFDDLDLNAALLFVSHRIFLIVSGTKPDVQAYLKNHRTQNIDVDSSGRPCKERLLTVLGEECYHAVFDERFHIADFKTCEDLERFMEKHKLTWLYDTFIKPCI